MRIIAATVLFAILATSALADNNQPFIVAGPQESQYRTCTASTDCVSFSSNCGAAVSINRQWLGAFQGQNAAMRPFYSCNQSRMSPLNIPVCLNGYCTFGQPDWTAEDLRDPRFCRSVDDCTAVTDKCGHKLPANHQYAPSEQAKLDAADPSSGCDWVENRPVQQITCESHRCSVLMNNYP